MLTKSPTSQFGATLIELVIVVTILAITATYGLSAFTEWVQNTQIRTIAESIQSGINIARAEAVRRNARVQFSLSSNLGEAGGTGWSVTVVNTGESIQSKTDTESSAKIVITSTNDASSVTFDGTGRFASGTVNPITQLDITSSVMDPSATRNLRIMISTGGQIRTCDPYATTNGDPRKC